MKQSETIFKKGSDTFYNATKFFPPEKREEVATLYAFVRVADDYVDAVPQDAEGFHQFVADWKRALRGEATKNKIVDDMYALAKKKNFDFAWVDAFLASMETDLGKRTYETLDETLEYIYGSAEVIGLFMARLMDLPEESLAYAKMLGRAMQFINFIRDIDEDISFGRMYLPVSEMQDLGLPSLRKEDALAHKEAFVAFVRKQLDRYYEWQCVAEQGYKYILHRYRIPIKTAADMYAWSGKVIAKDPFVVYERKVKPAKWRVRLCGAYNALTLWRL